MRGEGRAKLQVRKDFVGESPAEGRAFLAFQALASREGGAPYWEKKKKIPLSTFFHS